MDCISLRQATYRLFSLPPAPTPSREHSTTDWENQRSNIERLYLIENKPLKKVIECLSKSHRFVATRRQFKRKIKDWGLDKNVRTNEMQAIVRKRMKRKVTEGKDSAFRVRGRTVTSAQIKRWEDRQLDSNSSMAMCGNTHAVATPSAISCYTPSAGAPTPCMGRGNPGPIRSGQYLDLSPPGMDDSFATFPSPISPLNISERGQCSLDLVKSTITWVSDGAEKESLTGPPASSSQAQQRSLDGCEDRRVSSSRVVRQNSNPPCVGAFSFDLIGQISAEDICNHQFNDVGVAISHPSKRKSTSISNTRGNLCRTNHKRYEEEMLQCELIDYEKTYGAGHPATLETLGRLVDTLNDQGRYKHAESLLVQEIQARQKFQGADHPDFFIAYSNLATNLEKQGKYELAEYCARNVYEKASKILNTEELAQLHVSVVYQNILSAIGKHSEAEPLERKLLATYQEIHGPHHPHTLTCMNNLAITWKDQGRYQESELLLQEVVLLRRRVLGTKDSDTLVSMGELGSVFRLLNQYAEAESIEREVFNARSELLGPTHPDTLIALANLAATLEDRGKLLESCELQDKALQGKIKVLGWQHPETSISSHNLASVLRRLERYEEAEKHALNAWKEREKVLGPDHRDTLSSLALLGRMQADQGKYMESEASTARALDGIRKLENPDEQELLDSTATLAWIYDNHGRSEEVLPLYKQMLAGVKKVDGAMRRYNELCSKRWIWPIDEKGVNHCSHRANTYGRNSEIAIHLVEDAS